MATFNGIATADTWSSDPSKANIGISQLSIPLAWNSDQHFKSKGEIRSYSMFVVLETKSKVVDSGIITNVDRRMTDVVFPEAFVFEGQTSDFCVEVSIFATRTDNGSQDGNSLRTKISRSFGKKFGSNVKAQLSSLEQSRPVQGTSTALGGTNFNLVARAYLVLSDAGNEGNILDLKMSAFADLSGPPLYGQLMCRLAVQPESVLRPLKEGVLTVKPLGEDTTLKNVKSRLQAANLVCYMNSSKHFSLTEEETLISIPITSGSKIVSTSFSFTFLLATETTSETEGSEIFITTENEETRREWRAAVEAQIRECETWGEFSYSPSKLTFEKRVDPVKETLSRAAGNRLYDKINITDTVSRGTLNFSLAQSSSPRKLSPIGIELSGSQTTPTKRYKQRPHVQDVFPGQTAVETSRREKSLDENHRSNTESGQVYRPSANRTPSPMLSIPSANYSQNNKYSDYLSSGKSGKKSWSRSLGNFIGRKIASSSLQVTRL